LNNTPSQIDISEIITRFIVEGSKYARTKNSVRYSAFIPAPNGETSVFRVSTITLDETWEIGEMVADQRGKTLYGKADVGVAVIENTGLRVEPDTRPHPLHANIIDWPTEKSEQKLMAMKIADEAALYLK